MKLIICLLILSFFSCASRNKTVIAHRGASGYLPEHTLQGVAMAHAWSVDYIEPDLVLTKDNKVIVLHDIYLDTTTNVSTVFPRRARKDGRYYAIDFTLEEIKKLQVNERVNLKDKGRVFKSRFPLKSSSFKVPTFSEYIELVQGLNISTNKNIGLYPEIKAPEFHLKNKKDIAKITLDLLRKYDLDHEDANLYLQCFHLPTLKRLRTKLKSKVPMIALIADNSWKESSINYEQYTSLTGLKKLSKYVQGVGIYQIHALKSDIVKRVKKTPLLVHVYTHRSDQLPSQFKSNQEYFDYFYDQLEVDGVFSDFADTAMKFSK